MYGTSIVAPGFAPAITKLTSLIVPCIIFCPIFLSLFAKMEKLETSPCRTTFLACSPDSVSLQYAYAYTPFGLFSKYACPNIATGSSCLCCQTNGTFLPFCSTNASCRMVTPSTHFVSFLVAQPLKSGFPGNQLGYCTGILFPLSIFILSFCIFCVTLIYIFIS